ncbi:SIMPL domain-containing protein [Streptosporangiaceae bacterium NEAU-GS5]|nr:SIMPL domain-containing protein [Streptosporangiaceae bacterium NEAU-GS5]
MITRALTVACAVAGLLFASPVAGYASVVSDDGSRITVLGEGRISAEPDVMRLRAGVETSRANAGEAFAAARAAAARLTKALREAGVAEEDLTTTDLSLGPEYDNTGKVVGYRAGQGVEAIVRDLDNADHVIDVMAAVGDDVRFHGVTFELSKPAEAVIAAREAAYKDAEAKARQYAALSGRRLGRVLTISEDSNGMPGPIPFGAMALVADGKSISPGTQLVTVNAHVVYELR